jgi:hypothetical protein
MAAAGSRLVPARGAGCLAAAGALLLQGKTRKLVLMHACRHHPRGLQKPSSPLLLCRRMQRVGWRSPLSFSGAVSHSHSRVLECVQRP